MFGKIINTRFIPLESRLKSAPESPVWVKPSSKTRTIEIKYKTDSGKIVTQNETMSDRLPNTPEIDNLTQFQRNGLYYLHNRLLSEKALRKSRPDLKSSPSTSTPKPTKQSMRRNSSRSKPSSVIGSPI